MIAVLSPSKSMDMDPAQPVDATQPVFLEQLQKLISTVRRFSVPQLMEFMEISEELNRTEK